MIADDVTNSRLSYPILSASHFLTEEDISLQFWERIEIILVYMCTSSRRSGPLKFVFLKEKLFCKNFHLTAVEKDESA